MAIDFDSFDLHRFSGEMTAEEYVDFVEQVRAYRLAWRAEHSDYATLGPIRRLPDICRGSRRLVRARVFRHIGDRIDEQLAACGLTPRACIA